MKSIFKISVIFFSIFLLTGCGDSQKKKMAHFTKGNSYYNSEEYKKAELEFKNAIKIDSNFSKAYLKLGDTMMKTGRVHEAFEAYLRAEKLEPENTEALINLAEFYFLGKDEKTALEKIEKILRLDKKIQKQFI